jgi:XisH protein
MGKDVFHNAVKTALIRAGWTVTHDTYNLSVGGVDMQIDLGAEQLIGAEQNGQKIAVEVKSFVGKSAISEFHTAHGQYLDYYFALEEYEPIRKLYLAVPIGVYQSFFRLPFIQKMVQRSHVSLLIYNPDDEVIVEWL